MSIEISMRLEALARQADSMQTLANILTAQAARQKVEFAALTKLCAEECSTGNGAVRAPSLAEMLKGRQR